MWSRRLRLRETYCPGKFYLFYMMREFVDYSSRTGRIHERQEFLLLPKIGVCFIYFYCFRVAVNGWIIHFPRAPWMDWDGTMALPNLSMPQHSLEPGCSKEEAERLEQGREVSCWLESVRAKYRYLRIPVQKELGMKIYHTTLRMLWIEHYPWEYTFW